jgi:hypothetical protein
MHLLSCSTPDNHRTQERNAGGVVDFSDRVDRRVIPTGTWQRVLGALLVLLGALTGIAASQGGAGAGAASAVCFGAGGSLFFWGQQMLKYFSILEEKMAFMVAGYLAEEDFEDGQPEGEAQP